MPDMSICRCRRCGDSIGVVFRDEEVITFVICDKCGYKNIFVHDERNKKRLDEMFGKEED